jgi:hypothetical protein
VLKAAIALTALTSTTPLLLVGAAHLSSSSGRASSQALADIPAAYLALYQQATRTLCPGLAMERPRGRRQGRDRPRPIP